MPVKLSYSSSLVACDPNTDGVLIVGKLGHLKEMDADIIGCKYSPSFTKEHLIAGIDRLSPSPTDKVDIWFNNFTVAALPTSGSRHNAPMFPHFLSNIVSAKLPNKENDFLTIVCERASAYALGAAVARNFPLYNRKTNAEAKQHHVTVDFCFVGEDTEPLSLDEVACLTSTAESIRLAAKIVDMPCNEMHTDGFLDEVRKVAGELGLTPVIIQGEELDRHGFGGIYGVGKAAVHQPALAVLSHKPEGATKNIAWCGKGIVYDTGGLSIKGKTAMPGMKRDCGGAAGILGAFRAAVKMGFSENLHAVFCLAENAVGPKATRPDDVHTLYSGLTVEINNTDAEGRLVLGDGVAYARKDLSCDVIVDMATLTGAQGTATGHQHAAILTNNEDYEVACVKAGQNSGDLVHPLVYCPEFHFPMFESKVADFKNSVKRYDNASSACAGLFIGKHISRDFDYPGVWLHIDCAFPVQHFLKADHERATGYGVALLNTLFGKHSHSDLIKSIAPELD